MNRNLSLQERLRLQREGGAAPARPPASPVAPATPPPAALPVQSAEQLGLNPYTPANRPQMMSLPQQPLPPSNISAMAPPAPARPQSRDPIQRARNEAIYGGELQEQIGMKPKRGFWDIMKTAGVGALQGMATGGLGGAIGGALAGGIGSAISPEAGRGYRFDVMQRPRMEADIARQMAYDKFGREQRLGEIDLRKRRAEAEQTEAETRYLPARYGQESALRQSQIDRNKASAERDRRPPAPRRTPEEEKRAAEKHTAQLKLIDAQTKRAQRPPSSGGGGGAEQPTPAALNTMYSKVVQAKQEAEEAWAIANADGDPQDRATAEAALRAYNSLAEQLGRAYPQIFEVGPGQGGWNYIKERGR